MECDTELQSQQFKIDCHWSFLPAYKHFRVEPKRRLKIYHIGRYREDWPAGAQAELVTYLRAEANLDQRMLQALSVFSFRPRLKALLARHWYFPLTQAEYVKQLSKAEHNELVREACLLLQVGLGNYLP